MYIQDTLPSVSTYSFGVAATAQVGVVTREMLGFEIVANEVRQAILRGRHVRTRTRGSRERLPRSVPGDFRRDVIVPR